MANVLIIGANRGIGLGLTKKFLSQGHKVWALCRKSSDELSSLNCTAIENCEVSDLKSLEAIANELTNTKFDIFIHNAGIWTDENLLEMNQEQFEAMAYTFEINSIAPLKTFKTFYKLLTDDAKAAFLSSRMGSIADNDSGSRYSYRMSKAALNAAGKSLALDFPNNPIAILHPGFVRTDMTNHNGLIDVEESAAGLFNVIEKLNKNNTGKFWHSNGEELPW